ncbi:MAG: AIM24 family protein, partial [Thermoanaerobaculia bacterium]|nr:AIM24 family protein [Thermoanaerobaculia bacterium]
AGETMRLDTGCLVAFDSGVNYDIQFVGGVKTALFGGEGLFYASLTGPGKVWIQSLPFSRFASRVFAALPNKPGGARKGEGSALGPLGDLLMGD